MESVGHVHSQVTGDTPVKDGRDQTVISIFCVLLSKNHFLIMAYVNTAHRTDRLSRSTATPHCLQLHSSWSCAGVMFGGLVRAQVRGGETRANLGATARAGDTPATIRKPIWRTLQTVCN